MNKTAIDWCDYTWNPVTGCKHGCRYCYARKIAERFKGSKAWPQGFEPMLHHERLTDAAKKKQHQSIFVCSMADLFGEWVPELWHRLIFNECVIGNHHTYLFLTKAPARYVMMPAERFKENRWFGATITVKADLHRISLLKQVPGNTFISFEPLLEDLGTIDITGIKQVIIGAQTNPDQYVGLEWVIKICEAADRAGAKVFMKDSLKGRWPDRELLRELCWKMNK